MPLDNTPGRLFRHQCLSSLSAPRSCSMGGFDASDFLRRSGCVRTTPTETGAVMLARFGAFWRVCRRVVIASVLAAAMTAWLSARGAWEGSGLNRLNRSRFFSRCDCALNTMHFCRYAYLQLCTAARRPAKMLQVGAAQGKRQTKR